MIVVSQFDIFKIKIMEEVPRIALGTFLNTDEQDIKKAICFAVEKAGYRRIDTASIYGN